MCGTSRASLSAPRTSSTGGAAVLTQYPPPSIHPPPPTPALWYYCCALPRLSCAPSRFSSALHAPCCALVHVMTRYEIIGLPKSNIIVRSPILPLNVRGHMGAHGDDIVWPHVGSLQPPRPPPPPILIPPWSPWSPWSPFPADTWPALRAPWWWLGRPCLTVRLDRAM